MLFGRKFGFQFSFLISSLTPYLNNIWLKIVVFSTSFIFVFKNNSIKYKSEPTNEDLSFVFHFCLFLKSVKGLLG